MRGSGVRMSARSPSQQDCVLTGRTSRAPEHLDLSRTGEVAFWAFWIRSGMMVVAISPDENCSVSVGDFSR